MFWKEKKGRSIWRGWRTWTCLVNCLVFTPVMNVLIIHGFPPCKFLVKHCNEVILPSDSDDAFYISTIVSQCIFILSISDRSSVFPMITKFKCSLFYMVGFANGHCCTLTQRTIWKFNLATMTRNWTHHGSRIVFWKSRANKTSVPANETNMHKCRICKTRN